MHVWTIIIIYHILFNYRLYHQRFSLNIFCFPQRSRWHSSTLTWLYLPWIHDLAFAEVAEHVRPQAFLAQAPRTQKDASSWKWGTGPHVPLGYSHQILDKAKRLAKYQRNLSAQRRRKGRQRIAVKERQRKARSDVMSCSKIQLCFRIRLTEKRPVHCDRKIRIIILNNY